MGCGIEKLFQSGPLPRGSCLVQATLFHLSGGRSLWAYKMGQILPTSEDGWEYHCEALSSDLPGSWCVCVDAASDPQAWWK